jgi:hypothetical protein
MNCPYENKKLDQRIYFIKRKVVGNVVAVLHALDNRRELKLISPFSRVVKKNEIHELIITDEKNASPGKEVNNIAYIGFVMIKKGGIILVGDQLVIDSNLIGRVIGFDDTHMPNHQNIVLYSDNLKTGKSLDIKLEDVVIFQ